MRPSVSDFIHYALRTDCFSPAYTLDEYSSNYRRFNGNKKTEVSHKEPLYTLIFNNLPLYFDNAAVLFRMYNVYAGGYALLQFVHVAYYSHHTVFVA